MFFPRSFLKIVFVWLLKYKSSLHILDINVLSAILLVIFPNSLWSSFALLSILLEAWKFLSWIFFSLFWFCCLCFWCHSQKIIVKFNFIMFPYVFFQNFRVLSFIFRSLIHFEVLVWCIDPIWLFSMWIFSFSKTIFSKGCLLPTE